mmetsp:Transcript_54386/g.127140  ORF Transcript_54386/g.127140 Transcript_54386/m.127140 type:complete len:83 (-) Transcript_54386:581-829(-)
MPSPYIEKKGCLCHACTPGLLITEPGQTGCIDGSRTTAPDVYERFQCPSILQAPLFHVPLHVTTGTFVLTAIAGMDDFTFWK